MSSAPLWFRYQHAAELVDSGEVSASVIAMEQAGINQDERSRYILAAGIGGIWEDEELLASAELTRQWRVISLLLMSAMHKPGACR